MPVATTAPALGWRLSDEPAQGLFEPYAKQSGTKITEEEYNGEIAKIRAMVESKSVSWDAIDVDTPTAVQGCAEGILETIDWTKLGLDRSKSPAPT